RWVSDMCASAEITWSARSQVKSTGWVAGSFHHCEHLTPEGRRIQIGLVDDGSLKVPFSSVWAHWVPLLTATPAAGVPSPHRTVPVCIFFIGIFHHSVVEISFSYD
ncbi:hypothetical protein OLF92_10605, partial [Streptococcus pneumoniae]|nr:hypothetical protein [Streptococcus pneumoniae]